MTVEEKAFKEEVIMSLLRKYENACREYELKRKEVIADYAEFNALYEERRVYSGALADELLDYVNSCDLGGKE